MPVFGNRQIRIKKFYMSVVSDGDAIQGVSVDCQSGAYQQVKVQEDPTAT